MDLATGREAVLALVLSAKKHGFDRIKIKYAGGEPLLQWKKLVTLHEYALEACSSSNLLLNGVVLTNGIALQTKMIETSHRLKLSYSVSLDGLEYFQDQQRPLANGQGSFKSVQKSIEVLVANNIPTNISITLTSQNYPGLPALVRYLAEKKIPFSINFFRDHALAASKLDLHDETQGLIETLRTTYQILSEYPPYFRPSDRLLDRVDLSTPHLRPCGVGESYLVVDTNGNIAACQMSIDETFTTVTDPDPIDTMQKKEIYRKNPLVSEKDECKDCNWRLWCAGGCPLLTYRTYGRYDMRSPFCEIYKALMKEVLQLEALLLLK